MEDIKKSVDQINNLNVKTLTSNQRNIDDAITALDTLLGIAREIESIADKLQGSGFNEMASALQVLVDQVTGMPVELQKYQLEADRTPEVIRAVKELTQTVKNQKTNVDVKAPIVNVPKVDLGDLNKTLRNLVDKVNKKDEVDTKSIVEATDKVRKTIANLSFPASNYVLPYKDVNGRATQVQLDSSGNVPTVSSFTPSGTQDVNVTKLAGTAITTNSGLKSAGTQRVVLATDDINTAAINTSTAAEAAAIGTNGDTASADGTISAKLRFITNNGITANAGTNLNTSALLTTAAHDAAFGTAGTADTQVRSIQGIASMTPVQVSQATATNLKAEVIGATSGSGTATGAIRVELPTNGTGVLATVGAVTAITNALPAGTNAIGKLSANNGVDIGDVDVTSVTFPTLSTASTYSPTSFQNLGANATLNVKASAGNVFSLYCNNENAADRYIQLHNTATTPSAAAVPLYTFRVPAGGDTLVGTDFFTNAGANFSTGIAFAFSTTKDTYTAGTAGDHSTIVMYK